MLTFSKSNHTCNLLITTVMCSVRQINACLNDGRVVSLLCISKSSVIPRQLKRRSGRRLYLPLNFLVLVLSK